MTDKRFEYNVNKHNIEFDKKHFAFFNGEEVKIVRKLNELSDENEQLKQAIAETEKMVQSTYDELAKLRCIKNNLRRIQSQWDWIMEAIQYD